MTLTIRKDDQRKKITEAAWEHMGENKNGWSVVQDNSQAVENEAAKTASPPPTGEPAKKVDNAKVDNEAAADAAKNTANLGQNASVTNDLDKSGTGQPSAAEKLDTGNSEESPDEFVSFVKTSLQRADVKNLLDNAKVAYKQNAKDEALTDLLKEHYLGNIELLKADLESLNKQ